MATPFVAPARAPASDEPLAWYVARTFYGDESAVRTTAVNFGFDAYYPEAWRRLGHRQNRRRLEFPIFPGYVFVAAPPASWRLIFQIRSILGLLGSDAGLPPIPVPASDIDRFRHAGIVSMDELRRIIAPEEFIEVGDIVKIRSGPLEGYLTPVVETDRHGTLSVRFELFGSSRLIMIDRTSVEKVPAVTFRGPPIQTAPRGGSISPRMAARG